MHRTELSSGTSLGKSINEIFVTGNIRNIGCICTCLLYTSWRKGEHLPRQQGLVLGSLGRKNHVTALVDCDDIHCLMIGASGVGKTAFFLYPNLEYACASGMSYLALDTKGDLARNYGAVASKYYGYQVSVIDLRNPTRSDGNNLLTLINRYMDLARGHPDNLTYKARAEKYLSLIHI